MSYFITYHFDLTKPEYEDYQKAYSVLESLGLYRRILNKEGEEVLLFFNTVVGKFEGNNTE